MSSVCEDPRQHSEGSAADLWWCTGEMYVCRVLLTVHYASLPQQRPEGLVPFRAVLLTPVGVITVYLCNNAEFAVCICFLSSGLRSLPLMAVLPASGEADEGHVTCMSVYSEHFAVGICFLSIILRAFPPRAVLPHPGRTQTFFFQTHVALLLSQHHPSSRSSFVCREPVVLPYVQPVCQLLCQTPLYNVAEFAA